MQYNIVQLAKVRVAELLDAASRMRAGLRNCQVGALLRGHPKQGTRKLNLELLEDRTLLSTFTVINTNDSGDGSFRQAIFDADSHMGTDTVAFNLPGSGLQTISLTSPLPAISGQTVIDGATQPGFAGSPLVEIFHTSSSLILSEGSSVDFRALHLTVGDVTNNGEIVVGQLSTLHLGGASLVNNGAIRVNNSAVVETDVTLSGSGTLELLSLIDTVVSSRGAATLTQAAGHTILGNGRVTARLRNLGTVGDGGSSPATFLTGVVDNREGTITGGAVLVGVVTGGTLDGRAGSVFVAGGTLQDLTNQGRVNVLATTTLHLGGTSLVNNGVIGVPGQAVVETDVTLSGSGTLELLSLIDTVVSSRVAATLTQAAGHTILGNGRVTARLRNLGTVGDGGSSTATFLMGAVDNREGTITGGAVLVGVVTGGTLDGHAGSVLVAGGTLQDVTNQGRVNVLATSTLHVGGTSIVNNGVIGVLGQAVVETDVTLSGLGTLELLDVTGAHLSSRGAATLTQATGHTILGNGRVSARLRNLGTVGDGNSSTDTILTGAVDNREGTITGGAVLVGAVVTGGTLDGRAGSVNVVTGTLQDVTNQGRVTVNPGGTLHLGGTSLVNKGAIGVNSLVVVDSDVTVSGPGTLELLSTTGALLRSGGAATLTQAAGHTILGNGRVSAKLRNLGTVGDGASSTATFLTDEVDNREGTITGGAVLVGAVVTGGTLDGRAGSVNVVTGTLQDVTNQGRLTVNASGTLHLGGTSFVNNGAIGVNSLVVVDSDVTLSGLGTLELLSTAGALLSSRGPATLTQAAGHTILGNGRVSARLRNLGTVGDGGSSTATFLTGEVDNREGTITGGAVLVGAVVMGGRLDGRAGSVLVVTGTLQDVTNQGRVTVNPDGTLHLGGTSLVNNSVIGVIGQVVVETDVTVSGPGTLELLSTTGALLRSGGAATLTQAAGHTILGNGRVSARLRNLGTVGDGNSSTETFLTGAVDNREGTITGGTVLVGGVVTGGTLDGRAGSVNVVTGTLQDVTNQGRVTVLASGTLHLGGTSLVNNGAIGVIGQVVVETDVTLSGPGTLELLDLAGAHLSSRSAATLTQAAGHTILGNGRVSARLRNLGTVGDGASSTETFLTGAVDNREGTITGGAVLVGAVVTGGTLDGRAGSVYVVTGTLQDVTNQGRMTVNPGGTLRLAGASLVNNGAITVNGQIIVESHVAFALINRGAIELGIPVGDLDYVGAFTQTETGILNLAIGGTAQFNHLNVRGSVFLGGTLNIRLANGFIPNPGDRFEILTFTSRAGNFSAINGLVIDDHRYFQPRFAGSSLVLDVRANYAPLFDVIASRTVNEDAGIQTVSITGVMPGPAAATDEAGQTVTFTATSSNPGLIPNPTISGTGATRTLTYQSAPDANGSTTITVTANDGQSANNTFSRSFTINVLPVNDPPIFDVIADQIVDENAGPTTILITGVGPGPATAIDEADQTVTFKATSSNPAIVPNPTITGVGGARFLTFQPARNAFGFVKITVIANDVQGGTFIRTFTIIVNPVNGGNG